MWTGLGVDGGDGVEEGESGLVTPTSTLVESFYSEVLEIAKKWVCRHSP